MKDVHRLGLTMSSLKRVFGSALGRVSLALSVAVAVLIGTVPAQAVVQVVRTTHIVRVQTGADAQVREALQAMSKTPLDEIDFVFDGFIVKLADFEVNQLRANPLVVEIVPDQAISLLETDSPTPSWGLDRTDQPSLPLDNSFTYPNQGGAGVRAYIVDTGVQADNPDFAGRMGAGFDVFGANGQNVDCHGHGTHVAGTVAGTKFGLAKKATIIPVKVLSCAGSGSMSGIVTALDWIRANHPAGTPGVVNMSIGGPSNGSVTTAVNNLTAAGILSVVAAGNSNTDACTSSPASAPTAVTVGATSQTDSRAYFSNYGNCVDIFAPGMSIISADAFAGGGSKSMSGTSMASPHVAGAAALVLGQNPTFTPAQVTSALMDNARQGVVTNPLSANSGLLNIQFLNSTTPPTPPVAGVPDAPTGVTVSGITKSEANVSWVAPASDGGATVTGYRVEYRASAAAAWQPVSTTVNSATLTGLTAASNYQVQVSAINSVGSSLPSSIVNFTTMGDLPSAPQSPTATIDRGDAFTLGWAAPTTNGGNAITGYPVQQLRNGTWTQIGIGSASSRTLNVTGLTPATAYSFRISATNINGTGPFVEFNYTTGVLAPSTPNGVAVSAISGRSATVSWNPVNPPTAGIPLTYEVTWGWSGYSTVLGRVSGLTNTSYTMNNLASTTRYWVQVSAAQGTAASLPSGKVYFSTTANTPSAPLMKSPVKSGTKATLSWTPNGDGGSAIIDYTLQSMPANTSGATWTEVAAGLTVTSYEVDLPAIGQSVYYRVAARNAIGVGTWSLQTMVTTPAGAPGVPTDFAANLTGNNLTLRWTAPTETGGVALRDYRVMLSRDNGTTWIDAVFTSATTTTAAAPAKGQTWLYRVAARNASGVYGAFTAPVTVSRLATKASPPNLFSVRLSGSQVLISWYASPDNGGSPITEYRVETRTSSTADWALATTVAGNVLTAGMPAGAPGTPLFVRVLAVNAIGVSDPSPVGQLTVPARISDAPQNLTAVLNSSGTRVELTWQAPANNGGGTIRQYAIQYSANAGASWITGAFAPGTSTGVSVPFIPGKGSSYSYRIFAQNSAGNSPFSNTVDVSRLATVPGSPYSVSARLGSDGKITLSWMSPSDTGGNALTEFVVETLGANNAWSEAARVAATVRSTIFDAPAAGASSSWRVIALNSTGASAPSATATYRAPLTQASAPTNFTLAPDSSSSSRVVASWIAPTDLGGASVVSYYAVQGSANNGTTWSTLATFNSSTRSGFLYKPAKGMSLQVRILAYTAFGAGAASNTQEMSSAATVPGAPYGVRASFNSDGNPTVTWSRPSDTGGKPLTGYRVEQNIANAGWTELASVSATTLSATGVRANIGVVTQYRVVAINEIGASSASSSTSLQVPFLKPSAPSGVTATLSSAGSLYFVLSWQAPSDLGGANSVSYYRVERSTNNGSSWSLIANVSGLRSTIYGPARGTSAMYRVAAVTGYGVGEQSESVTYTASVVVPGAPAVLTPALDTANSRVTISWRAPSDNGGSAITGYRVDKFENSQWTTLVTTDGATLSTTTGMGAPGIAIGYRVYAINSVGISTSYGYTSIRMPYAPPSAPGSPVATVSTVNGSTAKRLTLSWAASANYGGSSLALYQIEVSTDGNGWVPVGISYTNGWAGTAPAAGTTVQYRVMVRTNAGLVNYSTTVSVTG